MPASLPGLLQTTKTTNSLLWPCGRGPVDNQDWSSDPLERKSKTVTYGEEAPSI